MGSREGSHIPAPRNPESSVMGMSLAGVCTYTYSSHQWHVSMSNRMHDTHFREIDGHRLVEVSCTHTPRCPVHTPQASVRNVRGGRIVASSEPKNSSKKNSSRQHGTRQRHPCGLGSIYQAFSGQGEAPFSPPWCLPGKKRGEIPPDCLSWTTPKNESESVASFFFKNQLLQASGSFRLQGLRIQACK